MLQSFAPAVMQLDLKITVIINWFYFSKEEKRQVVINQMNTFLFSTVLDIYNKWTNLLNINGLTFTARC